MTAPIRAADGRFIANAEGLEELLRSSSGQVATYLLRVALRVEARAKPKTPVDTGRLQGSITSALGREGREVAAYVGTNVEYAPYVHEGHPTQSKFLSDALREELG